MNAKDERLIQVYMYGWNDCGDNEDNSKIYKGIEQKAYNLGYLDFKIGDDVPSNDERSENEILREIKGWFRYNFNL